MGRTRERFAKALIYAILEMGALVGLPIRPQDIEEMTRQMKAAVVQVEEERDEETELPG